MGVQLYMNLSTFLGLKTPVLSFHNFLCSRALLSDDKLLSHKKYVQLILNSSVSPLDKNSFQSVLKKIGCCSIASRSLKMPQLIFTYASDKKQLLKTVAFAEHIKNIETSRPIVG